MPRAMSHSAGTTSGVAVAQSFNQTGSDPERSWAFVLQNFGSSSETVEISAICATVG